MRPDGSCQVCDPKVDKQHWSPRTGGRCEDDNPCTINDACKDGKCEGAYYGDRCSDQLTCTEDICDGKGGCSNSLKSGYCAIDRECYEDGDRSLDGCQLCDVATSTTAWTAIAKLCKVGNQCHLPDEKDSTGCGICDPDQDAKAWSQTPDTCVIAGKCRKQDETELGGCGVCNAKLSSTAFSAPAGKCRIGGVCYDDGSKTQAGCHRCDISKSRNTWTPISATTTTTDFEAGLAGFVADPAKDGVGWTATDLRAHGGSQSLHYGDPSKKNYDNKAINAGSVRKTAIVLPAGQKTSLVFWLYVDPEHSASFDKLTLQIDGKEVWKKDPANTVAPANHRKWIPIEVDLSAHAGKTITLSFAFSTEDAWNNSGEGVFIDDLVIYTACGPL